MFGTLSTQARVGAGRLEARALSWISQASRFDGKAAAASKDRSVDLSGTFSGLSLEALAGAPPSKAEAFRVLEPFARAAKARMI